MTLGMSLYIASNNNNNSDDDDDDMAVFEVSIIIEVYYWLQSPIKICCLGWRFGL
jgi:hypothetical protein